MADTKVDYERIALTIDGVSTFQITAFCTDAGDLPDTRIFVKEIVDPQDPLLDEFTRVATVADIEELQPNRDDALAANEDYWRDDGAVVRFTKVDVAVAAAETLEDRVNTLVEDYVEYKTEFETASEEKSYPTVDPTVVEQAKTAYATAVAAYETAQTSEENAKEDVDEASSSLSEAQAELTTWEGQRDGLETRAEEMLLGRDQFFLLYEEVLSPESPGTAKALVAALEDYLDRVDSMLIGDYEKLTINSSGYTPLAVSNIGSSILGQLSSAKGYVVRFDNTTREWWVVLAPASQGPTVSFSPGEALNIDGLGVTTNIVQTAAQEYPWDPEKTTLDTEFTNFKTSMNYAENNKTGITAGVANHDTQYNNVKDSVDNTYEPAVTSAEDTLKEKQADYVTAQGTTQAAYDAVIAAYDVVKAVCPNWSPDPPLPSQP